MCRKLIKHYLNILYKEPLLSALSNVGGCREMTAIKEGGVTHNESLLPKFLHKKDG